MDLKADLAKVHCRVLRSYLPLSSRGLDSVSCLRKRANHSAQDLDTVYFALVLANPAEKRTVHVSAGGGGRLLSDDLIATLHLPLRGCREPAVSMRPLELSTSSDPTFVLHDWKSAEELLEHMKFYPLATMNWALPESVLPRHWLDDGITEADLAHVCSACVVAGGSAGVGFIASKELSTALCLERLGFMQRQAQERWTLTERAAKSLRAYACLGAATRVFQACEDPHKEEATVFDLVSSLEESGWEWCQWFPPSARRRSMDKEGMFSAYKAGGRRVWYSALCPGKSYLRVLLRSEATLALFCTKQP